MKKSTSLLSLAFVGAIGLGFFSQHYMAQAQNHPQVTEINEPSTLPQLELKANQQLVVYYFHGNVRCYTCQNIEDYTLQAVQKAYPELIAQQQVDIQQINVEQRQHAHYIQDFQLFTRTVVLELKQDGRRIGWHRLDRTWELVSDQQQFTDYIYQEINRVSEAAKHV